jgi:hypothetical protein
VNSAAVEFPIHFIRERRLFSGRPFEAVPSRLEGVEPPSPAFRAGPVASGKRHGFVQEEQLRITARRHDGTAPAFEFQQAGDPTPAGILADDLAPVVVYGAAAVAHERSSGGGEDFSGWGDTVLQRHSRIPDS